METIAWKNGEVRLIDQTKLPQRLVYIYCREVKSMAEAIKSLKIRGAPAIGIAAAFGVYLGMRKSKAKNYYQFKKELKNIVNYLSRLRPTAKNLFWALERMRKAVEENASCSVSSLKKILLQQALSIMDEDKIICRKMAEFAQPLLKDGDSILTHCNAGSLATADYGTALGAIYRAKEEGKRIKVFVDETRPMLQGARLTSWELMREGIDVTLICDNMAAKVMAEGKIDKILVGADRIARNGDVANKIGSYNLAILAQFHKIPFYVVAPTSTFDLNLNCGKDIPIEERNKDEIRQMVRQKIAPHNVKVYNPAFDVTPAQLISAIVTEKGILKPPYRKSIREIIFNLAYSS
jgi:methylthioribose-1-phosphate isomerase